jgi:hypothetical protein
MRGGSGLHEACAALLTGVVVAACSGRGLSANPTEGAAGGDDGPDTPGFQDGADAAAGSLAVSLSASATASCPGQCVGLTPQIRGGIAPYTVRWSDGSTSGGGTREVCPTATTTYAAVVTDSSGNGGEVPLADRQAQASVTIAVTPGACAGAPDACPDGGDTSCAAGPDAGADAAGASVDPGDAPWSGCETIEVGDGVPLPDAGVQHCPSADSLSDALSLPRPLLAGQMYSIQATFQGLTGTLQRFALLASNVCTEGQSFFEQPVTPSSPFSGTANFAACITARADYPDVLYLVDQQMFSSMPSMTFTLQVCTGCGAAE